MTGRIVFLLVVALLVWLALPLQAAGNAAFVLQTDMFGSEQVPPVSTGAWGFVRFFFSDDRLQADYTVDVKGLSDTLVDGADIHRGAPGTNGPAIKHLADGGFIVTAGRLVLTQAELEEMVSGAWYVSLKTKDHPTGELRGQIVVPEGFLPSAQGAAAPASQPQAPASAEVSSPTGLIIRAPNTGDGGLAAATGHERTTPAATLVALIAVAVVSGLVGPRRGNRCPSA